MLCSDLVYSPASVEPLLSTLSSLVSPASTILYACEFREGAGLELLHQLLPRFRLKEQLVSFTVLMVSILTSRHSVTLKRPGCA